MTLSVKPVPSALWWNEFRVIMLRWAKPSTLCYLAWRWRNSTWTGNHSPMTPKLALERFHSLGFRCLRRHVSCGSQKARTHPMHPPCRDTRWITSAEAQPRYCSCSLFQTCSMLRYEASNTWKGEKAQSRVKQSEAGWCISKCDILRYILYYVRHFLSSHGPHDIVPQLATSGQLLDVSGSTSTRYQRLDPKVVLNNAPILKKWQVFQ